MVHMTTQETYAGCMEGFAQFRLHAVVGIWLVLRSVLRDSRTFVCCECWAIQGTRISYCVQLPTPSLLFALRAVQYIEYEFTIVIVVEPGLPVQPVPSHALNYFERIFLSLLLSTNLNAFGRAACVVYNVPSTPRRLPGLQGLQLRKAHWKGKLRKSATCHAEENKLKPRLQKHW